MGDVVRLPPTTCEHPQRYVSIGGRSLCEYCERETLGWTKCRTCGVLSDEKICPVCLEDLDSTVCPECLGDGYLDCEEFDCHGAFCEDGYVDCDVCDGRGTVPEVVARPRRIALTIDTGGRT